MYSVCKYVVKKDWKKKDKSESPRPQKKNQSELSVTRAMLRRSMETEK
jgi:hypothetical protein